MQDALYCSPPTYRFDSPLKAGMVIKASGTEWALACGVHFLKRLSEEWQRSLHSTQVTGRERERERENFMNQEGNEKMLQTEQMTKNNRELSL